MKLNYSKWGEKMRVFLSWSGPLSHQVALAFKEWLPLVIQSVDAYVSSEDIDKGKRWSTHIAKELETCSYGVICVTKENLNAPWVNFEAGALSKFVNDSYVSPFLLDLKKSEVKGPLLQFQSTSYDREDVRKLVGSINKSAGEQGLEESRLNSVFDVMWRVLETKLNEILSNHTASISGSENTETDSNTDKNNLNEPILEELLELSRSQQKLLNSPNDLIPKEYFREQVLDIFNDVTALMRTSNELQQIQKLTRNIQRNLRHLESSYNDFQNLKGLSEEERQSSTIKDLLSRIQDNQDRFMHDVIVMMHDIAYMTNELVRDSEIQSNTINFRKSVSTTPRRKPSIESRMIALGIDNNKD